MYWVLTSVLFSLFESTLERTVDENDELGQLAVFVAAKDFDVAIGCKVFELALGVLEFRGDGCCVGESHEREEDGNKELHFE